MTHTAAMRGAMVCGLMLMMSGAAWGQARRDLVKASLLGDVKAAAPGRTFRVGLHLKVTPDWHVYWENPGDSGAPTRLRITAPAGVVVGAVQYPLPQTFIQPGNIVGYGYEEEVMLVAPVTLPADWPAGKPLRLTADAAWLVCKDVCLPGKAKLELTIQTAREPEPDNAKVFEEWSARLPMTDAGALPFKIEGSAESFKLRWEAPVKSVQALTVAPDGIEVASTEVKHEGNATVVANKLRIIEPDKAQGASLGVLIMYEGTGGQQRGVRLGIPVRPR